MQKTTNYGLNQWDKADRIQMEDFNADNAKVDAALAGLAEQAALISKCGNCKIVCGSYVGNDKYGSSNPTTLTFDRPPALVIIRSQYQGSGEVQQLILIRNCSNANGSGTGTSTDITVTWSGNRVQWYSSGGTYAQYSTTNTTYYYAAFLLADG